MQIPGLVTPGSDPAHLQGQPRCRALGPLCLDVRPAGEGGSTSRGGETGPLHPQTIPWSQDPGPCTGQRFPPNSGRMTCVCRASAAGPSQQLRAAFPGRQGPATRGQAGSTQLSGQRPCARWHRHPGMIGSPEPVSHPTTMCRLGTRRTRRRRAGPVPGGPRAIGTGPGPRGAPGFLPRAFQLSVLTPQVLTAPR